MWRGFVLAGALALVARVSPGQAVAKAGEVVGPAVVAAAQQNEDDYGARPKMSAADKELVEKVKKQFIGKAEFQSVDAWAQNGVVTLEGSVPTKQDRNTAKDLARSVAGVRRVRVMLRIAGAGVAGLGIMANSQQQAEAQPQQNTAGSIAGNTAAANGTKPGTPDMAQSGASASSAPTKGGLQPGTAGASPGQSGGMAGTATASGATTQPGSNQGAGISQQAGAAGTLEPQQSQQQGAGALVGNLDMSDAAATVATIQNAFANNPQLKGVTAKLVGEDIELSGNVPTGHDKDVAMRLAQSYAPNRRVVDKMTMVGRGKE